MRHSLTIDDLGPQGAAMGEAIQRCVHCGFCLAACPTYQELGQEMDSPRGRIVLMKEVLEGAIPMETAVPHVDRCLGCLACEPACPSGVEYRNLLSPFRDRMEDKRRRSLPEKLRRFLVEQSLPVPSRFRWALRGARLAAPVSGLLPASMRPMIDLLPPEIPDPVTLDPSYPARGERRARVALMAGCAQQVLDPDINLATIEILTRHGVEVLVPPDQGCCGALSWHVGNGGAAREFARHNLDAFPEDIDALITNAAGCGSGMHEYPLMLAGTADEDRARDLASKVTDISAFLHQLSENGDLDPFPESPQSGPLVIAYQDACHLAHGQGIRDQPRSLLARIPLVQLVEIPDPHLCCGSAGTYNIDQPEVASRLGAAKAQAIANTGARIVASGNIGCLTQLRLHLDRLKTGIQVRHTAQILRDAWVNKEG